MKNNIKPKWYLGISVFILVIVFLIFGALPIQQKLGMWGLALTEIILLLFGLIPIFIFKWKICDVLPIKVPKLEQIVATTFLYGGSFLVVNVISVITTYLFPQSVQNSMEIVNFYSSVPFTLSFIFMAIMPGICEEILHRGFILTNLKNIKNDLIKMFIMAVIFGIFHLDPYRFLPTAFLGFILTYIMIKTENILLPIIFHFMNNAITVALSYNIDNISSNITTSTIGIYIILLSICPFLFYMANKILTPKCSENKQKAKVVSIVLTVLIFVCGNLFIYLPTNVNEEAIYNISFSEEVNSSSSPKVFDNILIENSGEYDISVSIKDEDLKAITTLIFENENGDVLWEIGGIDLFANKLIFLDAGKYKATFHYSYQDETSVMVNLKFGINSKK